MLRKNERAIPNNVYLEVWSEYGIFGFVVFFAFLISILITSFKMKEDAITAGILSLIISMNAFPSFIMFFIWVFLSIPIVLKWKKMNFEGELLDKTQ
jgi:O-antigen ligase